MNYVDGYVAAVPTENREAYAQFAQKMAAVFKQHGAVSVTECWGDDVPEGKLTSFPFAVKCEPHETVVFSWITWPSRAVRDEGWKTAMADPAMEHGGMTLFDGKRLIYGGFQVIVDA
jgi:uncharacterized protein YbaA (DUF1428 family)